MRMDPKLAFCPAKAEEIPADPIVRFVSTHHSSLWEAVRYLGGYELSRVVDRCAELLARDGRVTPRTRLMLEQILSVLSLERAHDPDLPFMACFAAIDPSDAIVDEICLLCDGLADAMRESARRERPGAGGSEILWDE